MVDAYTIDAEYKFDEKPHIMIIEARTHALVSDRLLASTKAVLDKVGATYVVHAIPRVLEIPSAVLYAVKALNFDAGRRRYDGYIALGALVAGAEDLRGISVDELMASYLRRIEHVSLTHSLAVGDGVYVAQSVEDAVSASDPFRANRGAEAAVTCLRMVELKHHFRLSPKKRWVAR